MTILEITKKGQSIVTYEDKPIRKNILPRILEAAKLRQSVANQQT